MRATVLIAEDDPHREHPWSGYLPRRVMTPSWSAAVGRRRPDLIIMDIAMANLDGLALRAALRHRGFGDIPVLFTSAGPRPVEVPPDSFIAKPFDLPTLLLLVHGCLSAVLTGTDVNR